MSDYIRPVPQARRSNLHVIQAAIAAGAQAQVAAPPSGGGANVDQADVDTSNDVVQVDLSNDVAQVEQ